MEVTGSESNRTKKNEDGKRRTDFDIDFSAVNSPKMHKTSNTKKAGSSLANCDFVSVAKKNVGQMNDWFDTEKLVCGHISLTFSIAKISVQFLW